MNNDKINVQKTNKIDEDKYNKKLSEIDNYYYYNYEKNNFLNKVNKFIKNRFNIISLFFIIFAIMIVTNTIYLQVNSLNMANMTKTTTGVARERIISAPRGNIYDKYGVPIAISRDINILYITNANLDNNRLNAVLLDLAIYLEENNINYSNSFSEYIKINPVRFEKTIPEIITWQVNRNTFNLQKNDSPELINFEDTKYVKSNPTQLFNYFRYTLFGLDPTYSIEESFKIMRLRYEIFLDSWAFKNGKPIEIAHDIDMSKIMFLEEQNYRFPGIISGQTSERQYLPDAKYLGHVIGYLGAISPKQFDELQSAGYKMNDYIGQSGIEYTAERYLRGQDGVRPYNILTADPEHDIYYDESLGKESVAGSDVFLTIDMNLQKIAMDSLKANIEYIKNNPKDKNKGDADSGAVVMLDVRNGDVLVMASYPSFDPNDFVNAKFNETSKKNMIDALTNTKDKPMLIEL